MAMAPRTIWPQLTFLDLSYNEIRTDDLAAFKSVGVKLSIKKLDLSGNKLSGAIRGEDVGLSEEIMPQLGNLMLSHNRSLVSFTGAAEKATVEMEGCNIITNSTMADAASDTNDASTSGIPRSTGLPVPDPDLTIVYKNCPAATFDSEPLAIDFDLYFPSGPAGPKGHPLVIWFHGGGLLQGNKENLPPHFRRLPSYPFTAPPSSTDSAQHIAVMSPNYRLAPQVPILDILSDIDALLAFIRSKLNDRLKLTYSEHMIDPERICLSGGSAGGYLALIAGMQMPKSVSQVDIGGYRGESGGGQGIRCLAPFYPITDLADLFWSTKTDPVPWYGTR